MHIYSIQIFDMDIILIYAICGVFMHGSGSSCEFWATHAHLSNRFSKSMLHTAKSIAASKLRSTGRHVWMEIVQKLVAVALVSVVSSANGFQLSVALSLGDGSNECACAAIRSATGPDGLASRICRLCLKRLGTFRFLFFRSFGCSSLPSSCDAFHRFQSRDRHQEVYNHSCPWIGGLNWCWLFFLILPFGVYILGKEGLVNLLATQLYLWLGGEHLALQLLPVLSAGCLQLRPQLAVAGQGRIGLALRTECSAGLSARQCWEIGSALCGRQEHVLASNEGRVRKLWKAFASHVGGFVFDSL